MSWNWGWSWCGADEIRVVVACAPYLRALRSDARVVVFALEDLGRVWAMPVPALLDHHSLQGRILLARRPRFHTLAARVAVGTIGALVRRAVVLLAALSATSPRPFARSALFRTGQVVVYLAGVGWQCWSWRWRGWVGGVAALLVGCRLDIEAPGSPCVATVRTSTRCPPRSRAIGTRGRAVVRRVLALLRANGCRRRLSNDVCGKVAIPKMVRRFGHVHLRPLTHITLDARGAISTERSAPFWTGRTPVQRWQCAAVKGTRG